MVQLSEDGEFAWDGKKWTPYVEPFSAGTGNLEEDQLYTPHRKYSQPPDWDVMETAERIAIGEFEASTVSIKFHDYERRKFLINIFAFTGLLFLLVPDGGILLLIFWFVISPVTVPIFLRVRSGMFYSKREKAIKLRMKVLKTFYEVEFRKQMEEADAEMADINSKKPLGVDSFSWSETINTV